jgi:ParB family chromosome partitioning protein
MTPASRRALTIDDPIGSGAPCHVARRAADGQPDGRLRDIPVEEIHPNPDQPRKRFDEDALRSLADSIRERGVLQPIIVRPSATGGFQLVAGERRWRAARLAGQPTILALVGASVEGAGSLELALIENVVREDLTPIEEATTIAVLRDDLNVTVTELAKRLGRSRTDLAHTVRLLDLPDEAIELIDGGALSKGHGKALLTEPDHHRRRVLAARAAQEGWSIRALEAEIARSPNPRPEATKSAPRSRGSRRQTRGGAREGDWLRRTSPTVSPRLPGDPRSSRRRTAHPIPRSAGYGKLNRRATWHTCSPAYGEPLGGVQTGASRHEIGSGPRRSLAWHCYSAAGAPADESNQAARTTTRQPA